MSKMLNALKHLQQPSPATTGEDEQPASVVDAAPVAVAPPMESPIEEPLRSDHVVQQPDPSEESLNRVEDRFAAYMQAMEEETPRAPIEAPREPTSLVATDVERRIMANMEVQTLRDQVVGLAKQIEEASSGRAASVSFHSCDADDNSLLLIGQLAMVLAARGGGRVLIVDAETRRQKLTREFNANGEAGLIEVFNATKSWRQTIRGTSLLGVSLLPAGRGALPDDLPAVRRFSNVVEQMLLENAYILVYGGEANERFMLYEPKGFLASYLVLQLGQSSQSEAREATGKLHSRSFAISGCIVTGPLN